MSADWQQQMECEQERYESELFCPYCGKVLGNQGRAPCCGEVGHGETAAQSAARWKEYEREFNHEHHDGR